MREILFRGKRVDNGEWVYGWYCGKVCADFWAKTKESAQIIDKDDLFWYEVIPETVGQYTELLDKNGQQIFEGDILKGFRYPFFREEDGTHNYFAEVVWFDNSPAFGLLTFKNPESAVSGISHGNTDYMENFASEMWQVIGNIHDKPKPSEQAEDVEENSFLMRRFMKQE